MTFSEFSRKLVKIGTRSSEDAEFVTKVWDILDMLDDADAEDVFGTQGWKHLVDLEN